MKMILLFLFVLSLFWTLIAFAKTEPTCIEAKRLHDTKETYSRWVSWDETGKIFCSKGIFSLSQ